MNEFRSTEQAGFYAAMDSAAFCFAFTEHTLKNVSALADSMVAALCSAGEANTQMLINVREDLAQRIAAAGALASAAAGGDLLIAQASFANRALERYAANARTLRTTVVAGARACREPLLERFS